MKTYHGYRVQQLDMGGEPVALRCVVKVQCDGQEYELPLRLDLRNHSPTGFEWGYSGSGPAQLALALLADVCLDATALQWYQRFKNRVVVSLAHDGWTLTGDQVVNQVLDMMRSGK